MMSVGFDWEKEDEKRRQRQVVDPHFIELQEQKKARARNAVLGTLFVLALAAGVILVRQSAYNDQLVNEMRHTAITEARALRSGNEASYLLAQKNVQSWPTLQDASFVEYQKQSAHLVPQGEVVEAEAKDGQGHVVLLELLDGRPFQVTWFYTYEEGAWKHVPPPAGYWGDLQPMEGDHVNLEATAVDEKQAHVIQDQMEAWWSTACQLTDCGAGGPDPLTVRLSVQVGLKPGWSAQEPGVALVPSPHMGRVGEDGSPDPALMQALARLLAEHWASWIAPTADDSTAAVAWFHDELVTYLAHAMGAPEKAPLLGPLADQGGKGSVMLLARRLQAGTGVIPALRELTGSDPLAWRLGWGDYLAARLRAEAALIASGKNEAAALYDDPDRPGALARLDGVSPASIQVESVEQVGDIAWARMTYTRLDAGAKAPLLAAFVPFRVVGDEWMHTTALPDDFGEAQSQQAAHATVHFNALDAEAAAGLIDDLEAAFDKASADLGIKPGEIAGVDVTIAQSAEGDNAWTIETPLAYEAAGQPPRLAITVASPHLVTRPAGQSPHELVRGQALRDMVIRMIRCRAYTLNPRAPLVTALGRWELSRLEVDKNAFLPLSGRPSDISGLSLDRLWARSQAGPFTPEDSVGARVLIEQMVDQHGEDAVSALLASVPASGSAADWLQKGLGVKLDDIHARWAASTQVAISTGE